MMSELLSLWLPIALSTVAVFVLSAVFWMAPLHHKNDWRKLPNEEAVLDVMRNVPPGQYMAPWCEPAEMKTEEGKRRFQQGPHVSIYRRASAPSMGRNLVLTFLAFLVTNVFLGYLAAAALDPGAEYLKVFQIVGTAGFMAYGFAGLLPAIWFGKSLRSVVTDLFDALVYGLVVAGFFGWLWPAAQQAAQGAASL